jgi:hypothetical protein
VIVIAPTRAACETIELAVGLHIETYLEKHFGARVRELARSRRGFGIVAGHGLGEDARHPSDRRELLGTDGLRVGVINREREATPETPSWNIIIVTTGIARRWFQDGDILPQDTLIVDEIHQTSAELELCLALGKRVGCRFICCRRRWIRRSTAPISTVTRARGVRLRPAEGGEGGRGEQGADGVPRRPLSCRASTSRSAASRCSCRRAREWSRPRRTWRSARRASTPRSTTAVSRSGSCAPSSRR